MTLWYLMSIIGFNVHICHTVHHESHHESHHVSYHVSHTEDHQDCCCHHAGDEVSFACCTDEYHVLDLPGLISSNENDVEDTACADLNLFAGYVSDVCTSLSENRIHSIRSLPDSGLTTSGDVQSVLGIWRI